MITRDQALDIEVPATTIDGTTWIHGQAFLKVIHTIFDSLEDDKDEKRKEFLDLVDGPPVVIDEASGD